ncbi:MAG TPA: SsrA-binding protein SmpB [Pseudomonadales bacterium]
MSKQNKSVSSNTIGQNKKARHEYFIEDTFEAGIALAGWEVKSLRAGKVNLTESYVLLRNSEAFLLGCHITPLKTASTHIHPDPTRTRKLLLHKQELSKIFSATSKKGYTCVALKLYWKRGLAKCEIALAKGKQKHDKRATEKEKDWNREKQRLIRAR